MVSARSRLLAVACLPALGFPAHAADLCDTLGTIAKAAPARFESLKGARKTDRTFEGKVSVQGASYCEVNVSGSGRTTYWCRWRSGGPDAADRLIKEVAACFPGGKVASRSTGGSNVSHDYRAERVGVTFNTFAHVDPEIAPAVNLLIEPL